MLNNSIIISTLIFGPIEIVLAIVVALLVVRASVRRRRGVFFAIPLVVLGIFFARHHASVSRWHSATLPNVGESHDTDQSVDEILDHLTADRIPLASETPTNFAAALATPPSPAAGNRAEDQAAAQLLAYLILQSVESQAASQSPEDAQANRTAAVRISKMIVDAANSDAGRQAADVAKTAGSQAIDALAMARSFSALLKTVDELRSPESAPQPQPPRAAATSGSANASFVALSASSTPEDSAPLASTDPPPNRPDWVDAEQVLRDAREVVLKAGPYVTTQECRDALEAKLVSTAMQRIRRLPGGEKADGASFAELGVTKSELLDLVFKDEYVETTYSPSFAGEMKTTFLLAKFTPEAEQRLLSAWQECQRQRGVTKVGLAALSALGGLGLVAGLLKVDTWTRGYYSKRLFLGVPAAIIALAAAIFAVVK